jgi:hypothetical protein
MSLLDIVSTQDEQFKENYPKIMKKIGKKKLEEMEPTIDEITKVNEIIINYIKQNKRKIYGGYALNKLLIAKNPSLAIYDEFDTPDIEFYSPDPMGDLVKLCDKLAEAGFKMVVGQEAQHKETYSIFVNYQLYCDISYMPSNIYAKTKYIQMDDLNLIHPWFMVIDYFRMFTDPLVSYWRLEKHFARYLKLQKTYPFPIINKPLDIKPFKQDNLHSAINLLEDYLSSLPDIIFTGFYAYNYYLEFTKYYNKDRRFKQIQIPYLEVYSTNYVSDGLKIIEYLKSLPEPICSKISHKEFYPFFQFYGFNTVFYYEMDGDLIPILYLYSNNNKCISFKTVPYIKFDNIKINSLQNQNRTIDIGSFDFNILHALIILVKIKVDDDTDWNDIIYTLINGFVNFRKYYLKEKKKTLYDDTIFEGFVVECKGESISPEREKRMLIQMRKKLGKSAIYRYESGVSKHPSQYYFSNSSGNEIKNEKNFQLKNENIGKKFEDELESEVNTLPNSEANLEANLEVDLEANSEVDSEANSEVNSEVDSEANSEVNSESVSEANSEDVSDIADIK